jgi:hypothetical protein
MKRKKKIPVWIKGGIIGAFVWLYDYDFLLNAGGPETPISDAIRNFFGMDYTDIFFPLFFLITIGAIIGGVASWIKDRFLKRKTNKGKQK